jgi:ABC-type polysaccharide/polyol phosphate export permease
MAVNPLTYGVAGIRQGLYPNTSNPDLPSMGLCLLVLALWGMVFYAISSRAVAKSDVKRRS